MVDEGNRYTPNNTRGAQMQPMVDDMHAKMHAYCVMIYTLRVVIYTARRDDMQCVALMKYNAVR